MCMFFKYFFLIFGTQCIYKAKSSVSSGHKITQLPSICRYFICKKYCFNHVTCAGIIHYTLPYTRRQTTGFNNILKKDPKIF